MADLVGTIVGVIGFGMQISQMIQKFGLDLKDAPGEVGRVLDELFTIRAILHEVQLYVACEDKGLEEAFAEKRSLLLTQFDPNDDTGAARMLQACNKELGKLVAELKRLLEKGTKSFNWARIKAAFGSTDTKKAVDALHQQLQLIGTMTAIDALVLSAKTHKEVVEGRKEQQAWHASAENEKVLTWLKGNSIDYGKQHGDFFSRLQEGSGQWLLQGDTFRQWLVGENRTLFCQGIPGAGKTMVACTVINYLQTSSELYTQQVAIVYLYCNYRRRDQQDPADLLTSLAAQLAEKTETMPIQLQTLYEQHNKKKTRPRISELEGLVESLLCSFEKTYVVVDALDECLDNGGHGFSCHEVIALIQQIQSEGETILNLFATSRALPDITDVFKGENCSTLEISADEGDMRQFLKARLPKILARSLVRKFPDIQDEIVTAIIEAAGGMFLLAQLYMNSLRDKATVKVLKAALMGFQASARESTSPDLKATQLDKAYNEAMERITMQSPDQSELAILCLSWVVCAKRPLLAEELQFALAVEVGEKSFDEENITDLSHILSVCNGLVTYDEVTTVVRLVHYTTQDYLEKEKQNWLPDAELNLSKVCLTYIQFDSLLCECRSSDCEPCSRLYNDKGSYTSEYLKLDGALASKGPSFSSFNEETYCLHITTKLAPKAHRFLTYASAYWGFHVTQCFNAVEHCILKLLEPQSHRVVDFLWRFICLNIRWGFWSIHGDRHRLIEELQSAINGDDSEQEYYLIYKAMALAVFFEIHEFISSYSLRLHGHDLRSPELWQRLLEFAIEIGKDAVVETIWSTGFITPEFRSKSGRFFAPLHFASERNKPTIFRSILAKDNVDPNVLEMSKIVRSRGRLGPRETLFTEETPLICASGAGHLSIVKILLEHKDIDVNRSDYEGKTALIRAAENGKEDVVALLIKREDIVLDSRCKKNGNAFVYSAKHSQRVKSALAVMKLLHATGKLDIRSTIEGVSAVGWAAKEGNCEKLQFLFELGFDPDENEVETKGKTPLITATVHSATDVVQLLLSTGRVNVNGTDRTDHTALAHAIRSMGHRLCRRTECGLVEIVGILLSVHDIDINRKYRNSGQNVLALLCSKNHLMSFEIDHSDHVNHPSTRHFYSLKREKALWHQKNCDRLILELLLSQKLLEVDAEDNNGRTPLSLAAQMRGPNILEILIFEMLVSRGSTEVHFNSRDEKGRTPLSWAVETRYTSSASTLQSVQDQISPLQQLLQLQFVDPNLKDLSGKSPLLWAAEIFKPAAMVAFLCCEWVDIFVRDSNGDGLMEYLFKHRPVRIEVPLIQDLYELRKSRMATEPLRYEEYKQWLEENTGPVLGWTSEEHDLILGPLDWDGSGDEI